MPFSHKIPVINEEVDYDVDLRMLLDQQSANYWIDQVAITPEFIICVKPLTYKHMTQTSIKQFETNRILSVVNDDTVSDDKKLELFNTSFNNLTKVTIDLMAESIYKIITPEGEVTDAKYIAEFVANADKSIFENVQTHLNELKQHNELKPLEFTTTEEQQASGAPANYTVPINFNDSDFFG
jgi:DNA replicative helicase MCM subunit Mcm2 (Cdc46/Mcm family)